MARVRHSDPVSFDADCSRAHGVGVPNPCHTSRSSSGRVESNVIVAGRFTGGSRAVSGVDRSDHRWKSRVAFWYHGRDVAQSSTRRSAPRGGDYRAFLRLPSGEADVIPPTVVELASL